MRKGPHLFFLALFTLVTQLLNQNLISIASASQKNSYIFRVPFSYQYQEKGSFKPPAKLSKTDTSKLLAQVCKDEVNKSPQLLVRSASGKMVSLSPMKPSHKVERTSWFKDENGENVFRFEGSCNFLGVIPSKLPSSNFYQFSADPLKILNWQTWSYPYTARDLTNLKSGITETRLVGGNAVNSFLPTPEIETPVIRGIACNSGTLTMRDEYEQALDTKMVDAVSFTVVNPKYALNEGEVNWPIVVLEGDRQQRGKGYDVEFQDYFFGNNSTRSPKIVTWKLLNENSFEMELSVYMYTTTGPEKFVITKEKTFSVSIDSGCKTAKVVTQ